MRHTYIRWVQNPTSVLDKYDAVRSEIKEATSFGAALVAWTLAEGLRPEALKADFTIQQRRIEPRALPGLEDYRRDFLKLARG